ncbi:unnamed protein product [Choristocarpus tenellus]
MSSFKGVCSFSSVLLGHPVQEGTRYAEGLLFGTVNRRLGTETGDTHEERSVAHREIGDKNS